MFPWAGYYFSIFNDACTIMMKVCVVAAQPGHTKESESVQLELGLQIVDSPGVIFEDDDSIKGHKGLSVLLHNIVKPKDVDDTISIGGCAPSPGFSSQSHLRIIISRGDPCMNTNQKIYEDL